MLTLGSCTRASRLSAASLVLLVTLSIDTSGLLAAELELTASEQTEIAEALRFSGEAGQSGFADGTFIAGTLEPEKNCPTMLQRELCRQALLIAARDGLGLSTRDRALRENLGREWKSTRSPVELLVTKGPGAQIRLLAFRREGDAVEGLWREKAAWPPSDTTLPSIVQACESFSRGELVDVLKQAGYEGHGTPAGDGPVSEETERLLKRLDFVSQYAATRRLHEEIRKSGDSPARLRALSTAYAQLGTLVEGCLSPAHKAFKARALLYAERAVVRTSGGPAEIWNRARVRTLLGMHSSALADIEAARMPGPDGKWFDDPAWGPALEAACRFDTKKLTVLTDDSEVGSFAAYLLVLTCDAMNSDIARATSAARCLEKNPQCLRAVDSLWVVSSLGTRRAAVSLGNEMLSSSWYALLKDVPGLSAEVREAAKTQVEVKDDDELSIRVRLIAKLLEEGQLGRDRGEPSLAVLAQLTRECGYLHAFHRVSVLRWQFRKRSAEALAELEGLIEGHPYAPLLEGFTLPDASLRPRAAELSKALQDLEIEYTSYDFAAWLFSRNHPETWARWYSRMYDHSDEIARDMMLVFPIPEVRGKFLRVLRRISPYAPAGVEYTIRNEWKSVEAQAAELEKRHANHVTVLSALGMQYNAAGQTVEAERCFLRCIELAPEKDHYLALADFYESRKQADELVATLEEFLETPSLEIEHANVRVRLARHFTQRKEFEKAIQYAEGAADTYAAFPMYIAVECHERVEHWKEAEEWQARISRQYESQAHGWYFWCRRTGHGDLKAARELAVRRFESLEARSPSVDLRRVGSFYLLEGESDKALSVFEAAFESYRDPYCGLHAALIVDSDGKAGQRDALLKSIAEKGREFKTDQNRTADLLIRIAELYRELLERRKNDPKATLDPSTLDKLRTASDDGDYAVADYFLARIFDRYGSPEEARFYYLRAATAPTSAPIASAMAAAVLQKDKVSIGRLRLSVRSDE